MSDQTEKGSKTKTTFWAIALFYFLIAFEFFYMASPFAIYFYSVYGPGLNFMSEYPALLWLTSVFLPHIVVETSSPLINLHNIIGGALFIIGFLAFCVTAGQVYFYKITRKGVVTGGVYRFIRHPQYTFLALCSFGLLLLWPRFIVIIPFIAMLFAYYFLAKLEEKECENKFGNSYLEYKNKTSMFLPFHIGFENKLLKLPQSGFKRVFAIFIFYCFSVVVAIVLATGVRNWTINSLYTLYSKDSVVISVAEMDKNILEQVNKIALSNQEVQTRLNKRGNEKFINYVLPTEWYVSEIRMNPVKGGRGHHYPGNYDRNLYKIVFTKADLGKDITAEGKDILKNAVKREPVLEVWLDLSLNQVIEIKEPPETTPYEGIPVPVY